MSEPVRGPHRDERPGQDAPERHVVRGMGEAQGLAHVSGTTHAPRPMSSVRSRCHLEFFRLSILSCPPWYSMPTPRSSADRKTCTATLLIAKLLQEANAPFAGLNAACRVLVMQGT